MRATGEQNNELICVDNIIGSIYNSYYKVSSTLINSVLKFDTSPRKEYKNKFVSSKISHKRLTNIELTAS